MFPKEKKKKKKRKIKKLVLERKERNYFPAPQGARLMTTVFLLLALACGLLNVLVLDMLLIFCTLVVLNVIMKYLMFPVQPVGK